MSHLFRYMKIEYLIDLLNHRHLPLIDPSVWEDKNDVYAIKKSLNEYEEARVCCFTKASKNSIYRWSKMSQEGLCVRVKLDKERCINMAKENHDYKYKNVTYLKTKEMNKQKFKEKRDLAFVKHIAYSEEKESRIVCYYKKETVGEKGVVDFMENMPLDTIKEIRFSPYVSQEYFDLLKEMLFSYAKRLGWKIEKKDITRSHILNNLYWKKCLDKIARHL